MQKRPIPSTRAPARAVAVLAGLFAGGCHVVEAKVSNLDQLHDEDGRHRYSAALEGDLEYFLRHRVAGLLTTTGAWIAAKEPSTVEDPAGECLANLLDLGDFPRQDPRIAGRQVEWFARLAVDDPYRLSRERCVLALGRAGAGLAAGVPVPLARTEVASGPEALAEALTAVVRSFRELREASGAVRATRELDLEAACAVVAELPLDLDGALRALRVATDLVRSAGLSDPDFEPVRALANDMQRVCIRRALASALLDEDPLVRAAAVEGSVACAGNPVLIPVLAQLPRETSPEVVTRVLQLVAAHGLPPPPANLSASEGAALFERWIDAIYQMIVDRPQSAIRVAAMRALARVSEGRLASLREEDWQAWWQARRGADAVARPEGTGS